PDRRQQCQLRENYENGSRDRRSTHHSVRTEVRVLSAGVHGGHGGNGFTQRNGATENKYSLLCSSVSLCDPVVSVASVSAQRHGSSNPGRTNDVAFGNSSSTVSSTTPQSQRPRLRRSRHRHSRY